MCCRKFRGEGGRLFLTANRVDGFLPRLSRNLHVLDDAIESVRIAPKSEKPSEKRQRLKLLFALIEQENMMLTSLKSHVLGRTESGSPAEPRNHYDSTPEIQFERTVHGLLARNWTEQDLELKCSECGNSSISVVERSLPEGRDQFGLPSTQHRDLCVECYQKLSGSS